MTLADCRRPLFAFRMIYRSSPAVVVLGRPPPTFLTAVSMVWNAFQARETTLLLIPNSAATLVTLRPYSSFPVILPRMKSFSFLERLAARRLHEYNLLESSSNAFKVTGSIAYHHLSCYLATLDLNALSNLNIPYLFLELIGNKSEFIFPRKTPKKISGKFPYRFVTELKFITHVSFTQKMSSKNGFCENRLPNGKL
ncbi:structural maintenance of chromosomes protein 2-2 [Trichonephila clavipes]|nr:structural maintenance of chromosomes protein 2-2 [Trichonephila clavipes]